MHWKRLRRNIKRRKDCSVLAKKMGGGGHKKAAGFQVPSMSDIGIII